ncbi:MAG: hypothetical protein JOY77_08570 [Alphaproteobacteria bacterium]|nr:hypothetical protein [Alphaproteobacteria bacterium]
MSTPTEHEIAREARRIFRKLADPKARLARVNERSWAAVQRRDAESGRTKASAALVRAFRERGWLEPDGERLRLSAAGRRWMAVELAGKDGHPAQGRHLGLRLVRDERRAESIVAVNEAESPLSWLKARGSIDAIQFEAGEKLRRDYTIAQLEPRMCTDLSAPVVLASRVPGALSIPDTVLAAKQRFAKAMAAVGCGLSDLLFDVCCALKGLKPRNRAGSGRDAPGRWSSP